MKRSYKKRVKYSFVDEIELNQTKYPVSFTAFEIPDGTVRFRVSINEGPVHIFGLDSNHLQYEVIDGSAIDPLNRNVVQAIDKLLQKKAAA